MTEEIIRNLVIKKLQQAGWITSVEFVTDDANPNSVDRKINWTPAGLEKAHAMFSFFEELGYGSAYQVGEFEVLYAICRSGSRV